MSSKKGISLPLNAIILIIIGVTVLIAVLIAFTMNMFENTETAQKESAVTRGCYVFKMQLGCDPQRVVETQDDTGNGKVYLHYKIGNNDYSLKALCSEVRGVSSLPDCCGCKPPANP